jgi:hypothetical protein
LSHGLGSGSATHHNEPAWTCGQLDKGVICPMQDCCPECSTKLDRVGQCLQDYNLLVEPQCLDRDCLGRSS